MCADPNPTKETFLRNKGKNRSCSNRTGFHSRHAGTTETCVGTREMIASEKLSSPRTSTLGFPSAVEGIPCREKQQVLAVKEAFGLVVLYCTAGTVGQDSIMRIYTNINTRFFKSIGSPTFRPDWRQARRALNISSNLYIFMIQGPGCKYIATQSPVLVCQPCHDTN